MLISVLGIFAIVAVALVGFGLYRRRWGFVLAGLMLGALLWFLMQDFSIYIRR